MCAQTTDFGPRTICAHLRGLCHIPDSAPTQYASEASSRSGRQYSTNGAKDSGSIGLQYRKALTLTPRRALLAQLRQGFRINSTSASKSVDPHFVARPTRRNAPKIQDQFAPTCAGLGDRAG